MYSPQSKIKKYLTVFTPSGLGMVLYVSVAGLLLVLHYFRAIQEYLGLPRNIEFAATVKTWLDGFLNGTLGQGRTEVFVVGLFWAFVGLAVYVFLRGISQAMFDITDSIGQKGYVWPRGANRNRPIIQTLERTAFQIIIFFVLVYWLLQPLARLLDGPVFTGVIGQSVALQYFVWFLMIIGALHIAVVLVRLLVLRARLFE